MGRESTPIFDICSNNCLRLKGGIGTQNSVCPMRIESPPEYLINSMNCLPNASRNFFIYNLLLKFVLMFKTQKIFILAYHHLKAVIGMKFIFQLDFIAVL